MKRSLFTIGLSLILAGCGGPIAQQTAPGAALPTGISMCRDWDAAGRCKDWSSKSSQCINPKGINEPEPVVPCDSIKGVGR